VLIAFGRPHPLLMAFRRPLGLYGARPVTSRWGRSTAPDRHWGGHKYRLPKRRQQAPTNPITRFVRLSAIVELFQTPNTIRMPERFARVVRDSIPRTIMRVSLAEYHRHEPLATMPNTRRVSRGNNRAREPIFPRSSRSRVLAAGSRKKRPWTFPVHDRDVRRVARRARVSVLMVLAGTGRAFVRPWSESSRRPSMSASGARLACGFCGILPPRRSAFTAGTVVAFRERRRSRCDPLAAARRRPTTIAAAWLSPVPSSHFRSLVQRASLVASFASHQ